MAERSDDDEREPRLDRSRLPSPPTFTGASAAEGADISDRRTRIFALIGNLTVNWSNNESLVAYILMLLMQTDRATALLVFGTLNTSRARIDLVRRLAKVKVRDPALGERLEEIVGAFEEVSRIRNEFSHSMFGFDERGAITHTSAMRLEERRGRIVFGRERAMDDDRLREMDAAVRKTAQLAGRIWSLLPELEIHLSRSGG